MNNYLFSISIVTLCNIFLPAKSQHIKPDNQHNIQFNNKYYRLDSLYGELYKYDEFNGNVLIAEHGKIIFNKQYGIANKSDLSPLTGQSSFYLASVTKQFTAYAMLLLEKMHLLSFNDELSKFLPELGFYKGVTINQLIHHTSGIPDYVGLFDKDWPNGKTVSNTDVIKRLAKMKPQALFAPNEKWQYSNTGYLLLAAIVEKVSGQSFGQFLAEHIFTPLKMDQTGVLSPYTDNSAHPAIAWPFLEDASDRDYVKKFDSIYGPGRIYSTVNDLFLWDRALNNPGWISPAEKKLLYTNWQLNGGKSTNYGYGWFLEKDSTYGQIVYHGGSWPGYLTLLERHLRDDKTIIILQNDAKGTGKRRLPKQETQKILYDLPLESTVRLPDSTLQKYTGTYISEKGKASEIVLLHRSIWIQFSPTTRFELMPATETKFIVNGFYPEVSYNFILADDGSVEKCRILQPEEGVDRITVKKKP